MEKIFTFFKEVRVELAKVTWPSKQEIQGSTIVVVIVSLIVSIFIGFVDAILDLGVRTVF